MNDAETRRELVRSIERFYGDLDHPNHSFMARRYESLRRSPFILEIMREFFVKDETDLNDDAALHLKILLDPNAMMLCLSFIDPWAMLFRLDEGKNIYVRVLAEGNADLHPDEARVMSRLRSNRIRILRKCEAIEPISMSLFNTDGEDVRIYHAIIDDCGIIPTVLVPSDDE